MDVLHQTFMKEWNLLPRWPFLFLIMTANCWNKDTWRSKISRGILSLMCLSQDTGQDEGAAREAGEGERIRRNPRRGQSHLQLRWGPHLRRHRVVGLVFRRQQHRRLQPPLPPPSESTESSLLPQPGEQWDTPGGSVRPGQQTSQRTPRCSRQVEVIFVNMLNRHPQTLHAQLPPFFDSKDTKL